MYAIKFYCRENEFNDVMILETLEQAKEMFEKIKQGLIKAFKKAGFDRQEKVGTKVDFGRFKDIQDYNLINGYKRVVELEENRFAVERLIDSYDKTVGDVNYWAYDSQYAIEEIELGKWLGSNDWDEDEED